MPATLQAHTAILVLWSLPGQGAELKRPRPVVRKQTICQMAAVQQAAFHNASCGLGPIPFVEHALERMPPDIHNFTVATHISDLGSKKKQETENT